MTHQDEKAAFESVTEIMIEHGPAAMASAFAIIMNCAIRGGHLFPRGARWRIAATIRNRSMSVWFAPRDRLQH